MEVTPVHPDDATAFDAWYRALHDGYRAQWGDRPGWQHVELAAMARSPGAGFETLPLAATEDGEVVGASWVELPIHDNRHLAMVSMWVPPAHLRRGVGSALLEAAEALATARGRTTMGAWHDEPVAEEGRSPGRRFALHHGYVVAQRNVRRELVLPVPAARLDALEAEALSRAAGYRVETFGDPWPDRWVDARLEFGVRMSTDAPRGEVDREDEHWDEARLRAVEALMVAMDRDHFTAVAVEEASGRPVAFSEIAVPRGAPVLVYQHDTLVLEEHRGHRLGLLVKLANLRQLQARWPQTATVVTYNAADNAHMIAVNEALGCRVMADGLNWQKTLA